MEIIWKTALETIKNYLFKYLLQIFLITLQKFLIFITNFSDILSKILYKKLQIFLIKITKFSDKTT